MRSTPVNGTETETNTAVGIFFFLHHETQVEGKNEFKNACISGFHL